MTKQPNGWEMSKRIKTNCKIYVQSFSGATTTCMEDYMKTSVRMSPDHFIIQKLFKKMANSIINPSASAKQLKTKCH